MSMAHGTLLGAAYGCRSGGGVKRLPVSGDTRGYAPVDDGHHSLRLHDPYSYGLNRHRLYRYRPVIMSTTPCAYVAYIVMVYVVTAYVVMIYIVMAYMFMAYIVMAYIVMVC